MDKDQLVTKLANRAKLAPAETEQLIDATLAELVAPSIFGTGPGLRGIFDNNCNNNCKAELAEQAPVLQQR